MKQNKMHIFFLAFFALLILLIILPLSPGLRPYVGEDSGIFLYHGRKILNAEIPYRDMWDHKGPVIYYLNALGLVIGNGSAWGVWFVELLFLFLSAILGFILIKKSFGIHAAFFATCLWLVSLVLVLEGGNFTEEFNIFFQFLSLFLFYQSETKKSYKWRGFTIGVVGALSFFLRQNLIGIFVSILLYLFISRTLRKQFFQCLKEVSIILLGFFLATAIIFFYFAINHALEPMLDNIFRFNFVYSSSSLLSKLRVILMGFWILARSGLSFVVFSGFLLGIYYFVLKQSQEKTFFVRFAFIWFPVELLFVSISGIHPPHYFLTWLPVFAILAGFFAFFCQEAMSIHNKAMIKNAYVLFLWAILLAMSLPSFGVLVYKYVPEKNIAICRDLGWFLLPGAMYFECTNTKKIVTEYTTAHTEPRDYVLLWGFGGSINFASNRKSPTRYIYQYPLFLPGYQTAKMVNQLYNDLVANKPILIIDTTNSTYQVPPLDPQKRKNWTDGIILPETNKIFRYIESHYKRVDEIGDDKWVIYSYDNNTVAK